MGVLWVFVIGMLFAVGVSLDLFRNMVKWRETAAKHQDRAAKLQEDLEGAQRYAEKLEKRMTFAEASARNANKQEVDAKDRLRAEQNKCEELRRMLSETRSALDGERESWTELLDREREKNRELYDDLMQERDAYAKLKNVYDTEKANLEKEIRNIMNYDGSANGQEALE